MPVYRTLRQHVERYEWAYGTQGSGDYRQSSLEHLAIIEAVRRGDGIRARTLVEEHWQAGAERTCATVHGNHDNT